MLQMNSTQYIVMGRDCTEGLPCSNCMGSSSPCRRPLESVNISQVAATSVPRSVQQRRRQQQQQQLCLQCVDAAGAAAVVLAEAAAAAAVVLAVCRGSSNSSSSMCYTSCSTAAVHQPLQTSAQLPDISNTRGHRSQQVLQQYDQPQASGLQCLRKPHLNMSSPIDHIVNFSSDCCYCCCCMCCSRERKQLTRTTADMFRLVPMIIILVSSHSTQHAL